jgi:hypothetical protein
LNTATEPLNMPIDPNKVQWDDEAPSVTVTKIGSKPVKPSGIDASKVAWDDEQPVQAAPYQRTLLQATGEAAINLPSSFIKLAKDTVEGFKSLPSKAPAAGVRFLSAKYGDPASMRAITDAAKSVGGYFADTYGDYEAAKNKFATDPAGFLADISTIFGLGAAAAPGKSAKILERAANLTDPTRPVAFAAEQAIKTTGKVTGKAIDVAQGKRVDVKASRIARAAAGEALPEVQAALRGTPSSGSALAAQDQLAMPRREPTASEATADVMAPEFQALAARVQQRPGEPRFYGLAEESAQQERAAMLAAVTPELDASIKNRELATQPFYQRAFKTVIPLDKELSGLLDRMPRSVLADASEIARVEGRPFSVGNTISGESLHFIKRALSDEVYAPPSKSKIGQDQQRAAGRLLRDYVAAIEAPNRIPVYGQARKTFAEMSAPVNQAQILTEMRSVLSKPEGGERATAFMNVLGRGEQALLKRTTGAPRYEAGDLANLLSPQQYRTVTEISNELAKAAKIKDQAKRGRTALDAILQENQLQYALPDFLDAKITIANSLLRKWQNFVNEKTLNKLAESFRTAKSAEELLKAVPAQDRSKLLRQLTEAEINSAILLAPAQIERANQMREREKNSNALAR